VAMDVGDEDASSDDATLDGPDVAAVVEAVRGPDPPASRHDHGTTRRTAHAECDESGPRICCRRTRL
jgi:hypothetical protein